MATTVPNQYTPEEHRLLMPVLLDNHLAHSSLIVKKVISLYFAKDLPTDLDRRMPQFLIEGKYEVNGSYMKIPVSLLSERFSGDNYSSKSRVEESFSQLLSEVNLSVKATRRAGREPKSNESNKELQAGILTNVSNVIHLTPEQEFKLTGRAQTAEEAKWKGHKSTVLLEEVNITDGYLNVKVSSFLQRAREHRNTLLDNKTSQQAEFVIIANYAHLLKFRSSAALQLYYLIAKQQPFKNYLIISVDKLCLELGIKAKTRETQFRAIRAATSDPALLRSTCALKAHRVPRKKDIDYFSVHKRDKTGILEIRLDFNSNEENKAELLAKKYDFIPHIKRGLNESVLLQIIARVADNVIDEKWVNYCVNEAYRANRRSTKKYDSIGPLVWNLMKELKFRDTYHLMDQDCELSPQVGLSIDEYRKKSEPVQLALVEPDRPNSRAGHDIWDYLRQQSTLEEAYLSYSIKYMDTTRLSQTLSVKEKNVSVAQAVKAAAHAHFKAFFNEAIIHFLTDQLGIQRKHANLIYTYIEEDDLQTMFGYFDSKSEQIRVPHSMRGALTVQFKDRVAVIIQNL